VFAADPRTGETALHRAAASGSVTLVRAILRRAEVTGGGVANTALALLTRRDAHGATALDHAEAAGRVKTARLLRRELSKRGAAGGSNRGSGYGDAGRGAYAGYGSSSAASSSDASDVSGESSSDDGGYGGSGASSSSARASSRPRRFTRSYDSDASSAGFWSDATPRSSVAGSDADAGSLWNSASESEGTSGSESEREGGDGGGGGVEYRRAPFPGGVRSDRPGPGPGPVAGGARVVSLANGDAVVEGGSRGRDKPSFLE
jgi:hypothetical protein